MTESGNMGPNSPFMKIELSIGHKSFGNAEKNAENRILISWLVIFLEFLDDFYPEKWYFEKISVKVYINLKPRKNKNYSVPRHLSCTVLLCSAGN